MSEIARVQGNEPREQARTDEGPVGAEGSASAQIKETRRLWLIRTGLNVAMANLQRLQALSLGSFRRQYRMTTLGPLHTLEMGAPCPGRPSWVFIHGYATAATDWAPLLRRMARHCAHIIAIDLPGHGLSAKPTMPITEEVLQTAMREVVSAILGDPPTRLVLVGHSMGGLGVVRLAAQLPTSALAGVVLISPLGAPMTTNEIDVLGNSFVVDDLAGAREVAARMFVRSTPFVAARALLMWSHLQKPHLRAMVPLLRSLGLLTADDLAELPPTLLVWGEADRILPLSHRDFYVKALPTCTLVDTPHFGHMPFLDYPNEVEAALTSWARNWPDML